MTALQMFGWMLVTGIAAFFGGWSSLCDPPRWMWLRLALRLFTTLSMLAFIVLLIVAGDTYE